jgi:nucleoside phosphorylase/tetratricopeptide (TPR) repeat protein
VGPVGLAGTQGAGQVDAERVDVLIITAVRDEYEAVRRVDTGAMPGSRWEETDAGVALRSFQSADGGALRVAVAKALEMGTVSTTIRAMEFVKEFRPSCLAMCGVCAGFEGKVALGDVIVADLLWTDERGKLVAGEDATGQRYEHMWKEPSPYHLNPDWRRRAEAFAPPEASPWLAERPLPQAIQRDWVLERLVRGEDPKKHPDRKRRCADYPDVLRMLWKQGWLEDGKLQLTAEGRLHIERELNLHPDGLPEPEPFRVHVGAIATGQWVRQDRTIFQKLSKSVRTVLGLEMEGWAIGAVAHQHQLPFLVMKGVMDFAHEEKNDRFKAFAARASAECLLAFVRAHLSSRHDVPAPRPDATDNRGDFGDILDVGTSRPPPRPGPAALLTARHRYVPFFEQVRAELLGELREWCDHEEPVSARVFHGAGGVGKTRLFIEWTERLRGEGWTVGFLVRAAEPARLEALVASARPTLIVIDYAESRLRLDTLLRLVARKREAGRGAPLRVALLARTAGDWLRELQSGDGLIQDLVGEYMPLEVTSRGTSSETREEMFLQARRRFAELRGCEPPSHPPPDLGDARFERILYVHMAALAAVLGKPFTAEGLMGEVLDHEERFWVEQHVPSESQPRLLRERARRAVAALTLLGGAMRRSEAEALLTRANGTRDESLLLLLHDLYPGGRQEAESAYLGGLEPDLLGDAMVLRALLQEGADAGDWLERVCQGADERGLRSAFTLLGRLSVERPEEASRWTTSLLEKDLGARAVAALEASKALGQRTAHANLGLRFAAVLARQGTSELALRLEMAGVPVETVSLMEVSLWVTETLLRELPKTKDPQAAMQRSHWFARLSHVQARLGRMAEALKSSQEAVSILQWLMNRHREGVKRLEVELFLARGLDILCSRQFELGHLERALASSKEAVTIHRDVVRRHPGEPSSALASALIHLGAMQLEVRQPNEALQTVREAESIYRSLFAKNPGEVMAELAATLDLLSMSQRAVGQRAEALKTQEEAVRLASELARAHPDRFLPHLAKYLVNRGIVEDQAGLPREALASTEQSVEILRQLAAARPDAFLQDLAVAWNNLGNRQAALGLDQPALESARKAVEVYRKLAEAAPEAFSLNLAGCLHNLGSRLIDERSLEEALDVSQEAVALCRKLVKQHPKAFLPSLAMTLMVLGIALRHLGRLAEALAAQQESLGLYQHLARENRDSFLPEVARGQTNLGMVYQDLGHLDEALKAHRESVDLYRELEQAHPRMFVPDLANTLNNLGAVESALGHATSALALAQEALDAIWPLFIKTPSAFLSDTHMFLNNVLKQSKDLGREPTAELIERLKVFETLYGKKP